MLSAFTARPIVELKQRDKSKIESVLAYGDRLLVGLNTGCLRIYRVNDAIDESSERNGSPTDGDRPISQSDLKPVDLMRELEKFSKYKVEQLAVIKEANILVSLSNSQVNIHDLQSYELQETLVKAKGASTFAVTSNVVKDESTGVPSIVSRLAVAVKRRLVLWSWHDSELAPETSEIMLVNTIRALKWATGTRLIAGLNSSYVLVDVETSAVTDIIGPGSIGGAPGQDGGRFSGAGVASMGYLGMTSPPPLATQLGEGEMLLAKDINTLFIDTDSNSLGRRQIPWSVAPEAVGYSYPYLLALQATKGTLEVRNPETLTLLQTISLPSAHQLHVPQPNVSLAHAGKGFLVLSDRCIWRMKALEYDAQIDTLVERGRLDEALSLLGMLEDALLKDKRGSVRDIKIIKAQQLFDQRRYRDSIDLFTEVSAPPERVIRMYPPFIAGEASPLSPLHKDNSKENHFEAGTDGAPDAKTSSVDTPTTKLSNGSSVKDSTEGSEQYGGDKPLEGKDLKTATEELRGFLVSARTKFKKILDPDENVKVDVLESMPQKEVGEIASLIGKPTINASDDQEQLLQTAKLVDTTLFRAYMFVSPSFAGPLFRIDNFCDPDVVNERLIEAHRYNDLVDFFYGKKLHRPALELLKEFGEAEKESEDAPQLHGPQRTVAYLQNLPPEMIDLILHFVEWPLRKDADLGMEVFMADTENADTLQRPRVLEFLQNIDEKLAKNYLEHIIQELNDRTPEFHQRLVNIYIERLKSDDFVSDNDRAAWKEKTLDFLKTSKYYQPYKAFQRVSKDDPNLFEARAILLSNMGQHKQALEIYVFQLKDADKAEEYCNQIHLIETATAPAPTPHGRATDIDPSDAPPSIYHTLLSLYLSPPPPHKPQWGPALNILAKHGARMPASSTLNLIPEILPIKELESYFRGRIRSANTLVNEGRIVAGMRSTLAFSEETKLRLGDGVPGGNAGRNRRVVITENRVCGICYKRFGGSAIKVMPEYV
ncbi:MAG: Vacuolar morphoproteinsis protein 6 [Alectoria fallacina]|uniref:Vacuolar morphoproteinsis protein 6 n=1 Tax=Alectoria fallacina TaxID=1903189 RepID=A0A8H3I8J8_9LECA|nr:MAG: Vacuolar morphoproteinsis protein 6 [Alectoria fallacina]